MGDKRELIKRKLESITNPWSSDEEDSRHSLSNSRSYRYVNSRQNVRSLSTFSPTRNVPPNTPANQNGVSIASSTLRNEPTRIERNLFWSILNNGGCSTQACEQGNNRPSTSADTSRQAHSERRTSNAPNRSTDIRHQAHLRILGLKKALRELTQLKASASAHNCRSYPSTSTLHAGNNVRNRRLVTLRKREPATGNNTNHNWVEVRSAGNNEINNDCGVVSQQPQPGCSSEVPGRRQVLSASMRNATPQYLHDPLDQYQEDDDVVEINGNTCADNEPVDVVTVGESSGLERNVASAEISLEEEVLEVETIPVEVIVTEEQNALEQHNGSNTSVPAEPSTSGQEKPRGLKRKREESKAKDESDVALVDLNKCLLRLLECPVCLEWMEPPMCQCRRGHLVCVRCRSRLSACPVCRTAFSSVRNRAMEELSEMISYPCRHGCGVEVRLRVRSGHEASCPSRKHQCPAPQCVNKPPLAYDQLAPHFQNKHPTMVKVGRKQKLPVKVNVEIHEAWIVLALDEIFHLRLDVDVRNWSIHIYVAYIGAKINSKKYTYEVTVAGKHNGRKLVYTRNMHSDLESVTANLSRHDCFHLSLEQALNFLRINNRSNTNDNFLNFTVLLSKAEALDETEDTS